MWLDPGIQSTDGTARALIILFLSGGWYFRKGVNWIPGEGDRRQSCLPASELAVTMPVLTCGLSCLTSVPHGVQTGSEVLT